MFRSVGFMMKCGAYGECLLRKFQSADENQDEGSSTITVPDGVDVELLMNVLGNPEMAALFVSLAKTMKT